MALMTVKRAWCARSGMYQFNLWRASFGIVREILIRPLNSIRLAIQKAPLILPCVLGLNSRRVAVWS